VYKRTEAYFKDLADNMKALAILEKMASPPIAEQEAKGDIATTRRRMGR
jgi:hypothetical protein